MPWFGKSKKRRKPNSKLHKTASRQNIPATSHPSPPIYPSRPRTTERPGFPSPYGQWPSHSASQQQLQWSSSTPQLVRLPLLQQRGQQAIQNRWASSQNLPGGIGPYRIVNDTVNRTTEYLNRGAALYDNMASRFNDAISLIDEEPYIGSERDLRSLPQTWSPPLPTRPDDSRAIVLARKPAPPIPRTLATLDVFTKANMYANSRVPGNLPILKVYTPSWPLICLAARHSLNAYRKPVGAESDAYVEADWRLGTKAMVIKSVPLDDRSAVVFAIRGTQSLMDWAVNFNTNPISPEGFLDDAGNKCHAGFLDVARKMIKPVAARLRGLLAENPRRGSYSLVITGHSAGGAVASLLFSHMLSQHVQSELTVLTGHFKRVHCVTFGAPPISLLALNKPVSQERRLHKYMFFSFINEGDPVTRADKAYVRSLLDLYGSPAPKPGLSSRPFHRPSASTSRITLGQSLWGKKPKPRPATAPAEPRSNEVWTVPPTELSNAGRCVLLRASAGREQDVRAYITNDEELRRVVFGDPLAHSMKVYSRRVESLAQRAATGRS